MSKSIFQAAHENDLESLRSLLSEATAVDPETGWTALHYAAEQNSAEAAQMLLDAGAAADARTPHGETPLHLASGEKVARLLLGSAAAQDADGFTPAERALRNGSTALFQVLADGLPESPEYQILRYACKTGRTVQASYRGQSLKFRVATVGWTMRDERCLAWQADAGWQCLEVRELKDLTLGGPAAELPADSGPPPECVVMVH